MTKSNDGKETRRGCLLVGSPIAMRHGLLLIILNVMEAAAIRMVRTVISPFKKGMRMNDLVFKREWRIPMCHRFCCRTLLGIKPG